MESHGGPMGTPWGPPGTPVCIGLPLNHELRNVDPKNSKGILDWSYKRIHHSAGMCDQQVRTTRCLTSPNKNEPWGSMWVMGPMGSMGAMVPKRPRGPLGPMALMSPLRIMRPSGPMGPVGPLEPVGSFGKKRMSPQGWGDL